jgi:hypothetical protein
MLIAGGCATTPVLPPRWQLTVPTACGANIEPGTVWLQHAGKKAEDGNSYVIKLLAATNPCADEAISADLATNQLPARRCHIDLSIDGGSNWIRRIGYGVQADAARVTAEFTWSPPEDYSLLTTNAMLRAVSLDGGPWPARVPARVYDIPEGQYPVSFVFPIVGATITNPVAGAIMWQGNAATINWIQSGGGAVWDLYWLTPDSAGIDVSHWLTTISNAVEGANSKIISLNVPVAEQARLAIVSSLHPSIIGYSPVFTVDP